MAKKESKGFVDVPVTVEPTPQLSNRVQEDVKKEADKAEEDGIKSRDFRKKGYPYNNL